jgi:hypothetical protein|tara:strand:+ start:87 stop:821 length:735 start_codon:yes stop_codon:yes gene_type:complete
MPSGQVIRVDSRTGVTYDLGTTRVSAWASQGSSNVSLDQGTASKQPLYQATGFGASMPGVLFDGSDDILFKAFSAMGTQAQSIAIGLRYTGGASNYHQAGLGGSALGAGESNSDNYYNGFGLQPTSPGGHADGFAVYQGPSAGSGYNLRASQPAGTASTVFALGQSFTYAGGTNVVKLSRTGSSAAVTTTLNDFDLDQTLASVSLGQYNTNTLEGQLSEAHVWDRALRQEELNRATRVVRGRQQ